MRDLELVSYTEPFENLLTQGMVLNDIFYRKPGDGRVEYFNPAEIDIQTDEKGQRVSAVLRSDGQPVESGGIGTMSKSKNNGVDPQALIEKYGADTARFFMMFASPPEQTLEWSDSGVEGAYRFLKRLWAFCEQNKSTIKQFESEEKFNWHDMPAPFRKIRHEIHLQLQQANHDLGKYQFNTVASACMKMLNILEREFSTILSTDPLNDNDSEDLRKNFVSELINESVSILLRVLSVITPHICDYLWQALGYGDDILNAPWPEPDPGAMVTDEVQLVVQVNGKLRGKITLAADADDELIKSSALADENVQRFTDGKTVRKIIIVPGRLVNIVIS